MEWNATENIAALADAPCLLFEPRKGIAPIEAIVILFHKDEKKIFERKAESLKLGKRLLLLVPEDTFFPRNWIVDCWKRGEPVNKFVRGPMPEDLLYLDMFYVLYCCPKENWVFNRLRSDVLNATDSNDEQELAVLLNEYLRENKYHLNPFHIVNKANGARYLSYSPASCSICSLLEKWEVLSGRLLEKMLRFRVVLHGWLSHKRFIARLKSSPMFLDAQFHLLDKKGESSSGCVFIQVQKGDKHWFVKGDESPLFHGIVNEINIQNRLMERGADKNYLQMEAFNRDLRWIGYPFENKRTLRHILKERTLTEEELRRLGLFIIETLDGLNEMNIIHRDYRIENIMAEEDGEGAVVAFTLFDFGCSVMDGIDIWKKGTFWDNYLSRQVCGEGRYNERIVDDAAAACNVYLKCGGKPDDRLLKEIEKRIGRLIV